MNQSPNCLLITPEKNQTMLPLISPWTRLLLAASVAFAATLAAPSFIQPGSVWAAPILQTGALAPDTLANTEYFVGENQDDLLTLEDGLFEDDTRSVRLVPEYTMYGDFTGDGLEEAIVILETTPVEGGPRYDLAVVMEQDGAPLNLVTLPLGEQIRLDTVGMVSGEIVVNLSRPGPDPAQIEATDTLMPTAAWPFTQIFVLEDDQVLQFEIPGLTPTALANATYTGLAVPEEAITLVDGEYADEEAGYVVSLTNSQAWGDLDGDLIVDAAVVLVSLSGGTGVFYDLAAVLNDDGAPVNAATTFLGDRISVEDIFIDNGVIVLDVITHGPDDPLCCPTQSARLGFALEDDTLIEVEIEEPTRTVSAAFGPLLPRLGPGGFGYVNLAGEYVIAPQFQAAFPFSEGLAPVAGQDGIFGYIDTSGQFAIPPQYTFADDFHQGIAVVGLLEQEGRFYINRQGEILFDGASFADARPFAEGLAAVRTAEGQYGFIDRQGNLAIEPRFEMAQSFSDGLALVRIGGQYGFINRSGRFAIAAQFTRGGSFSEGLAPVEFFGQFGYINGLGDLVIGPQFEMASSFREGFALVVLDGQEFYIDPEGNVLNPELAVSRGNPFHEGLAAVAVDGLVGYLDNTGQLAIPPQFLAGSDFEHGMAVVQTETTWGVINPSGAWLLELSIR